MKLNDIANRLRLLLPSLSNLFSDFLTATSITSDGTTVTIVFSSDHGLTTGQHLSLSRIGFRNQIDSVATVGENHTFTLANDSDQSINWYRDFLDFSTLNEVELKGFTDPNWNSVHTLTEVLNRRKFLITNSLTSPTLNGSEYILEIKAGGINSIHQITVVDSTTVTIPATGIPTGIYEGGVISRMPRVGVAYSFEDFKDRVLSPQIDPNYSMAVVPGEVVISKDRTTAFDAVSAQSSGNDFRLMTVDSFHIYIAAPTNNQLSGAVAIDTCRHILRGALYKCLFGANFDTGMSSGNSAYRVVPISDGIEFYNRAMLIYSYSFQFPFDTTLDDIIPPDINSAFRDIDYNEDLGDGVSGAVDLDEEPLT